MSEDTPEPGSLEFIMNTAVLSMNRKLKDHGYNERERAAMWEMTVAEHREFLTRVWEHMNNDKTLPVEYPEHWVSCVCGQMKVAPGTRTELASVSHGEASCFDCDDKGRIIENGQVQSISLVAEEPNPEAGVHPIEVKPTPPKPGPPGKATKSTQTNN